MRFHRITVNSVLRPSGLQAAGLTDAAEWRAWLDVFRKGQDLYFEARMVGTHQVGFVSG
jgi:hypothetical protein